MKVYLDSSALVKLVQPEPQTPALRRYLRRHAADLRVASALARVEVVRAVGAGGAPAVAHARRVLTRVHQVDVSRELIDEAADLAPGQFLRSLDAIHVATARAVGSDLRALVTYDTRMAAAAAALALPVEAPA